VTTYAFSLDPNALINVTPIATVGGAPWTSSSTVVPTNVPVVITAVSEIVGFGEFVGWFQAGLGLSASPTLNAPATSDIQAVAFYKLASPSNLGAITGTVQEDTDGGIFQITNALVSAQPGGDATWNPDGTYAIANLEPGPVEVFASARHTTQPHGTVTVVAGQTITYDIVLTRLGTRF
jgi:hypothetical protein